MTESTKAGHSTDGEKVVIYDVETRTISLAEEKDLPGTKDREPHILPRFVNRYDILEDEHGLGRRSPVATVDLSHLPWSFNFERRCGRMKRLYVMSLPAKS
ncbi:MAG: hypothetical protein LQ347_005910 [Umbilicaria vellea]|nr:MAG: hypothetical protein LQ347_005910 [Umbilicaria vellea]